MPFTIFNDMHGGGNSAAIPAPDLSNVNGSAISLRTGTTNIATAGAETRTLAPGVEGQVKVLRMSAFVGNGVVTLTGNPAASDVVTLSAVDQSVVLLYTAGRWLVVQNNGAAIA